jgi:succinate dehydrogenase / fumarate reductase flavoprotein subunit
MLAVAEAVTLSALERRETRGGHSRSDYPQADPELGRVNVVVARRNGALVLRREPIPPLPDDLRAILEEAR